MHITCRYMFCQEAAWFRPSKQFDFFLIIEFGAGFATPNSIVIGESGSSGARHVLRPNSRFPLLLLSSGRLRFLLERHLWKISVLRSSRRPGRRQCTGLSDHSGPLACAF